MANALPFPRHKKSHRHDGLDGSGTVTLGSGSTIDVADADFTVHDDGDTTKKMAFQVSGVSTGTTRTFTVPNYNGTLATLAGTEALTNKTLGITNVVTLRDDRFSIQDDSDPTRSLFFDAGNEPSGSPTIYAFPGAGGTLVTTGATQSLANKTLTTPTISSTGFANANHAHAAANSGGTVAHSALTGGGSTSHADIDTHIAATAAHGATGAVVGTTNTQTVQNKTLDVTNTVTLTDNLFTLQDNLNTSKQLQFQLSGITASSFRILTVPDFDGTIATLAGTETFTNKTLTSPSLSSPTITTKATMSSAALLEAQGAQVTAINDLVLGGDGNAFKIDGTTQINHLASTNFQSGTTVHLVFNGALTVKHNQAASGANLPILLQGSGDFVTATNNTLTLTLLSGFWYEMGRKT